RALSTARTSTTVRSPAFPSLPAGPANPRFKDTEQDTADLLACAVAVGQATDDERLRSLHFTFRHACDRSPPSNQPSRRFAISRSSRITHAARNALAGATART